MSSTGEARGRHLGRQNAVFAKTSGQEAHSLFVALRSPGVTEGGSWEEAGLAGILDTAPEGGGHYPPVTE